VGLHEGKSKVKPIDPAAAFKFLVIYDSEPILYPPRNTL